MAAVEARIEVELTHGSAAGLIAEIDELVRQNPLREHLRALQLVALYRAGRQTDALAAYHEARSLLREELGLEPSEELQRLEKQILTHDPALDAAAPVTVEQPPGAERAPEAAFEEARKLVTILSFDIAADNVLGTGLDPEDLRLFQLRSSQLVAAAIERHRGTLINSAGGEGTVAFGVLAVHEDDALRALRAAVEIRDASSAVGLRARIGVASGEVIVDGPASVAGVAVAVARRLAEAAPPDEVLIGAHALALTTRAVDVEQVSAIPLRGGAAALRAFRLLRVQDVMEPQRGMRFVGREREVALIRDAWGRVTDGPRCELITVIGDPGIGKSRLAAEALAPLDAHIVQGRCLPYGDGITYRPVTEVLNQLGLALPGQTAESIRALLGESEAGTTAVEVPWAFRKTLERAAAERAIAVVFEDLQWGEDAFLDLVEECSLLSTGAPILLVCLARPELLHRRPAWPGRQLLEPLTDTEIEQLLPARLADPLRGKITRASGGNPLFVQEMLAVAGDSHDDLVVPTTLQAVLAARIDQLDPDERAVLTYGAIEGETFHHGAIQAFAPAESHVSPLLAGLVRKGLIRPDRADLPGEDGYRFRHILIRDAAYATLPRTRRGSLHADLADWLVTTHSAWSAGNPDILAYHYLTAFELAGPTERSGELKERAVHFSIASGERAADIDPAAAIASFERALELGIDEPRERARIQLELGFLLDETGRIEEAEAIIAVGLDAAADLDERGLAARARVRLSHQRLVSNPDVGGEEIVLVADEAIETLTQLGDALGLARAERMRAMALSRLGRTTESYPALERALLFADESGDAPTRRYVIGTLCYLLCDGPAPVGEAIARCEQLRDSCGDDRVLQTLVSRHLCHLLAMAGRFDESNALLPNLGSVYDELNQVTQHGLSRDSIAEARELLGDPAGAEQELLALLEIFRGGRGGAPESRALRAAALLALLYADEERWDAAAACVAYGAELPPPAHFRPAVVLQLAAEARLAWHRGDYADAVRNALSAVELVERSDRLNLKGRVWVALSQVRRGGDEIEEADSAAATALRLYEAKGNVAAAGHLRTALDPA
jgi:class 3 adenylate cyclase/tetratricopeptide (TPR) repeat protein